LLAWLLRLRSTWLGSASRHMSWSGFCRSGSEGFADYRTPSIWISA
jgi:hypothetical protein